jgi:Na+/H+ antiporter NhaD/arsenite permease-like protein
MPSIRLVVFAITYLMIALQQLPGLRLSRPAASLLGAVAMVVIGGLPLREAYAAIDLDVLVFLLGVLLVVAYFEVGGFFDWCAALAAERAVSPRGLLAAIIGMSGLLSALFVNDTVCLVLPPLIIASLRRIGRPPLPYLLAIAMASNVGSAMTIIGNPQNMLIGIASGMHFARFLATMILPAVGGLILVYLVIAALCRRELDAREEPRAPEEALPPDRGLLLRAGVVFGGALIAWLAGLSLPLVAITAGAVMIAIAGRDPDQAFARVEWSLLLFFASLFVVARGVADEPLVHSLTMRAVGALGASPWRDATIITAAVTALSNVVSNVPAVLLWLPVVPRLSHPEFYWCVIAMAATFAGNLTLLGSMANLIVAERAQARGVQMPFGRYLAVGVPVTVVTLAWGVVTLVVLRG